MNKSDYLKFSKYLISKVNKNITEVNLSSIIDNYYTEVLSKDLRMLDVLYAIKSRYDIKDLRELKIKTKKRNISDARHVVFYLLYLRDRYKTLQLIADVFTMNHSSVLHACRKVNNTMDIDKEYKDFINYCKSCFKLK